MRIFVPAEKISLQNVLVLFGISGALLLIGARVFGISGSNLEWYERPACLCVAAFYVIA